MTKCLKKSDSRLILAELSTYQPFATYLIVFKGRHSNKRILFSICEPICEQNTDDKIIHLLYDQIFSQKSGFQNGPKLKLSKYIKKKF